MTSWAAAHTTGILGQRHIVNVTAATEAEAREKAREQFGHDDFELHPLRECE